MNQQSEEEYYQSCLDDIEQTAAMSAEEKAERLRLLLSRHFKRELDRVNEEAGFILESTGYRSSR